MANDFDIIRWSNDFEKSGASFDYKKETLDSGNMILYPGRFYILHYRSTTKKSYNSRPVIISLGPCRNDPDKFVCIDLCMIPKAARLQFIKMYWKTYEKTLFDEMVTHISPNDADTQAYFKDFTYENLMQVSGFGPIKNAIKKYKKENTYKIYAVPYNVVYKMIGKFCDEDYMVNDRLGNAQGEFFSKATKKSGK